jgi:hypothetical protein
MLLPREKTPVTAIRVPPWLLRVAWRLLDLAHLMLAFAPLVAFGMLYALSWRGESLIGHWPHTWVDDPHFIGQGDSLYGVIEGVFGWVFLAACIGCPVFFALTAVLSYKRASLWPLMLWLIYAAGWILFMINFGDRWSWFVD